MMITVTMMVNNSEVEICVLVCTGEHCGHAREVQKPRRVRAPISLLQKSRSAFSGSVQTDWLWLLSIGPSPFPWLCASMLTPRCPVPCWCLRRGKEVLLHYHGWKPSYDEWVHYLSTRLSSPKLPKPPNAADPPPVRTTPPQSRHSTVSARLLCCAKPPAPRAPPA